MSYYSKFLQVWNHYQSRKILCQWQQHKTINQCMHHAPNLYMLNHICTLSHENPQLFSYPHCYYPNFLLCTIAFLCLISPSWSSIPETNQRLRKSCQLFLRCLFIIDVWCLYLSLSSFLSFSSNFSLIFFTSTFLSLHLLFLLFSFISLVKCQLLPLCLGWCLFQFPQPITNHKWPPMWCFSPLFNLEYVSHELGRFFPF